MRHALALLASLSLFACNQASPTREISGRLGSGITGLSKPVMIAESSDLRVFVAPISKSGTFRLALPAGVSYRITLANTVRAGVYTAVGKVHWPLQSGARRWATVGAGDALDLGVVYKRTTSGGSSPLGVR
jgi:hypothetical protein